MYYVYVYIHTYIYMHTYITHTHTHTHTQRRGCSEEREEVRQRGERGGAAARRERRGSVLRRDCGRLCMLWFSKLFSLLNCLV